jgi:hypothetical protein
MKGNLSTANVDDGWGTYDARSGDIESRGGGGEGWNFAGDNITALPDPCIGARLRIDEGTMTGLGATTEAGGAAEERLSALTFHNPHHHRMGLYLR